MIKLGRLLKEVLTTIQADIPKKEFDPTKTANFNQSKIQTAKFKVSELLKHVQNLPKLNEEEFKMPKIKGDTQLQPRSLKWANKFNDNSLLGLINNTDWENATRHDSHDITNANLIQQRDIFNKKQTAISAGAIQQFIENEVEILPPKDVFLDKSKEKMLGTTGYVYNSKHGGKGKDPVKNAQNKRYLRIEHSIPVSAFTIIFKNWKIQKGGNLNQNDLNDFKEKYFGIAIVDLNEDKRISPYNLLPNNNTYFNPSTFDFNNPPQNMWKNRYDNAKPPVKIIYDIIDFSDEIHVSYELDENRKVKYDSIKKLN